MRVAAGWSPSGFPFAPFLAISARRGVYDVTRDAMMQLYWAPKSRSLRALWLMEEAGVPYERVRIDIRNGGQTDPAFRAVNPMAKVPALQDGEACVAESGAICAYVADAVPQARLAPPIGDPRRGRYLQWLFFSAGGIEPAFTEKFAKVSLPSVSAGWGSFDRVFDVLDTALAQGSWLLGDQFTAADVLIGADLYFGIHLFKIVPDRPHFAAYLARCQARSAFQRAVAIDAAG